MPAACRGGSFVQKKPRRRRGFVSGAATGSAAAPWAICARAHPDYGLIVAFRLTPEYAA